MIFLPKIHTQKPDWHSGCANACVSCVNSIVGNAICNFQVRWRHHAVCSWTSDVMIGPNEMGNGCAFRHRNKYAQLAYQCLCKIVQVWDTQRKHISNCASNRKKKRKKYQFWARQKKSHTRLLDAVCLRWITKVLNSKYLSLYPESQALGMYLSLSLTFTSPAVTVSSSFCLLSFADGTLFIIPAPLSFFLHRSNTRNVQLIREATFLKKDYFDLTLFFFHCWLTSCQRFIAVSWSRKSNKSPRW